jgi:ERF superfamily
MHTEQLDLLAAALVKAQTEFTAIPKDSANPFFKSKYAGLPVVVEKASPILSKNGLAISQHVDVNDHGHDVLVTYLLHTSGQFLVHAMRLHLVKDDPQAQGSAITYARRYSYMAVLGLVADDDDDGNAASLPRREAQQAAAPARVQEIKEQVKRGPQHDVATDTRFDTIKQGAAADPTNKFLADLVQKGGEYGKLSEKQLAAGFNAARKALDNTPRSGEALTIGEVAGAFGASEEPF